MQPATVHDSYQPTPLAPTHGQGLHRVLTDHARLKDLFAKVTSAPIGPEKLALTRELITFTVQHQSAEDRTLYPLLLSKKEGDTQAAKEAKLLYDMLVADDMLGQATMDFLQQRTPNTAGEWSLYDRQVKTLIAMLLEHIAKEEEELLPWLAKWMTPQEQQTFQENYEAAWQSAPLKAHPMGGSSATMAKIMHPVAGMVDRVTHAVEGATAGMFHGQSPAGTMQQAAHEGTDRAMAK
jgi:hemerythrin superfamily protein